jgi:hypothetical protein
MKYLVIITLFTCGGLLSVAVGVGIAAAMPNRENAVGTYQISCGARGSMLMCKIIDTRTGDVVGGE